MSGACLTERSLSIVHIRPPVPGFHRPLFGYPIAGQASQSRPHGQWHLHRSDRLREEGPIEVDCWEGHGLRATAITNAMEHEADIVKAQAWLGYASISTIIIYERSENRPKDSPTYATTHARALSPCVAVLPDSHCSSRSNLAQD
jgi:hypothetical protein